MPSPHSPTDAAQHYWTAEVNDVVGGWIVTNDKLPATEHGKHDFLLGVCTRCLVHKIAVEWNDRCKAGYIIAETFTEQDAIIIASCLNRAGVRRP